MKSCRLSSSTAVVRATMVAAWLAPASASAIEPSTAQTNSRQSLAEALFQEARDLTTQGKAELACPKFAESQRIDPATGTLLNLAACHESIGKLATAWSEFSEAATAAERDGRDDRVHFAKDHIRQLEQKLSRLTIRVREDHAAEELSVRLDDVRVGRAAWNTALPVDPGAHVVSARAPSLLPWQKEIMVATAQQEMTVEVPDLRSAPRLGQSVDGAPEPARTRRAVMLGAAGVGAAGIVAGSVFGLYALERWYDAERACPTGRGCSAVAIDARASASRFAMASDIAFAAGIVGAGVAGYLWMNERRRPPAPSSAVQLRATPVLAPTAMGVAIGGEY